MGYPITTFAQLDVIPESAHESTRISFQEEPNANSTTIDSNAHSPRASSLRHESTPMNSTERNSSRQSSPENPSSSVGHISHIPRIPPTPGTYTVPSIINKSIGIQQDEEHLYGMVKLREHDVCYTSGTIEWVGRKRSFPINSGFKIVNDKREANEPLLKRVKSLNNTFTNEVKECSCTDVLPTVNAIVDHLNALHEAVDIIDLRLNTLEDVMSHKPV